jgi:hypothetical protein
MKMRVLFSASVAVLIAGSAHATVYIDSINVANANAGNSGLTGDNYAASLIGQSFTANAPDFTSISLTLSASSPTDGKSVMVYLVPDDGSGGAIGVAGNPTYAPVSGGATFTGFTNAASIGTISDSALTTSPSTVTLAVPSSAASSVASHTADNEYWVVLSLGALGEDGSSALWWFNAGDPNGEGTGGQAFWNNGGTDTISPPTYGPSAPVAEFSPYQLKVVAAPEPISAALLGVGLAGLGYIRRRSSKA